MASFNQRFNALINIADEYHTRRRFHLLTATGKRARRHVIFHNLHAVFIFKRNTRHLIKGNKIPHTYQADFARTHVIKKIRNRGLPARYQNTVRRAFFINMRFTRSPWAQFTHVIIVFYKRNHAG